MEERKYDYSALKMDNSIRKQLLIITCINIGQIIVGWSVGWTAPIIPKLQDLETSPLPEVVTDLQASWIGSLLYIGSVVGPYVTSILSNMIGRKPCLIIGGVLNVIAYILVVSTNNIAMIYAVRVVSGLGMGITIVSNIVYVGEIASTHIRGILLTSTSIIGITGTLLVYAIGPFVSYVMTGYIALAICLIHLLGIILVVPESPVYYAMKDNDTKAAKILNMLGRSKDIEKVADTFAKRGESSSKIMDWVEIFTIKSNRKSLLITFLLGAFQQTSGVAVVLFFATTIFQLAGSTIKPDLATIIIGVTRLLSSLIAPLLVESKGRRILLLISMAACACSLSILGVYFYLDRIESPALGSIGWLPLVSLIVYFFCYEAGFGTIPNAIVGEMFRANVRANGSALAITMTWLVGFGLTTSFTTMLDALGGDVTFWLFGSSCIVAFLFTYFFVPETKGKTLHEIQEMMS
ncbi:facilitated trehalose transporter Tret1-like [Trichoplusia ni]|uniref:Facilitated trehalose transporter Tret1-like n=1 Tax=Trichoplusia ni TaxID=7111 RepID=A0A7E5VLA3_TRINI|nr:facilitated trehalose transporter Tret1-like [Trichoplusia ni]